MKDEDIYNEAQTKVKAKKGFFYHFLAYAFVIGLLYVIMQYENNGDLFPVIIVGLSWGIGIAIHYFQAFGTENLSVFGVNPHWEEDELEQEIEKLKRKRELKEQLMKEKNLMEDLDSLELKEIEKRARGNESDI
ncbi:MAG: 2TM domain-containing protein [Saprospiraceae bacterium]|nr:2TM domain-containing protein [Saprospiraceae bacterium]